MHNKMQWYVARPGQKQKQRESQAEKFFLSDAGVDRAEDLVREALQNSMDARAGDEPVLARIGFGTLDPADAARYAAGLEAHLPELRKQMPRLKSLDGKCHSLVFEDFHTTGLTGDPNQERRYDGDPPNHFHAFFRAEGKTDKTAGELGSHGIGKIAFMAASDARMAIGLTRRSDDARTLCFGTAVFRSHCLNGEHFECDAWFGLDSGNLIGASEDENDTARLRADFGLTRSNEPGLSVVVPWLNTDAESGITPDRVIDAVLRGHASPILHGELVVEVRTNGQTVRIDSDTFLDVLSSRRDESLIAALKPIVELMKWGMTNPPPIELGRHGDNYSPKWSDDGIVTPEMLAKLRDELAAERPVAIRIPLRIRSKERPPAWTHFEILLKRALSTESPVGAVRFVRRNLLISGMSKQLVGTNAVVYARDNALNEFLRAAENVAHNRWDSKAIKDEYKYAKATLAFLVSAVHELLRLLANEQQKPDTSLLIDLFSLPSTDDDKKTKQKKRKKKDGGDSDDDDDDPPKTLKRFVIDKFADGFVVRRGDPGAKRPQLLAIKVAYGVRRGSPFNKYDTADFRLFLGGIESKCLGCEVADFDDNWASVRILDDDFRFEVTGFDTTHRDLHIDVKVKEEGESEEAAAEEVADAKAS